MKQIVGAIIIAVIAVVAWQLQPETGDITLSNARGTLTMGGPNAAVVTLDIDNAGAGDVLLGAQVTGGQANLSQHAVPIGVPAHTKVSLTPEAINISLTEMADPLEAGAIVPLSLIFENAGTVNARVIIAEMDLAMMMHGAKRVMVDPAPQITGALTRRDGGYTLTLETQNFTFFQPDTDMAPHVDGQGHAHLYVNGLKLGRLFSPQAQFGALSVGTHVVTVSLNTNDHVFYAGSDGGAVQWQTQIEVQ